MEIKKYPFNQLQNKMVWNVSWLSLGSSIYALYNGHYDIAFVPGGIFLTSINYWRYPDYSWRRYIDIYYVYTGFTYQLIRAYRAEYATTYYSTLLIALVCYPTGMYYHHKQNYWYSAYMHCLLHIIANISNLILYSGRIEPVYYSLDAYHKLDK